MADETLEIICNVEDGTCVSGANSYVTLEWANQYQTNKNRTDWLALSDNEKLASLIKGTQYVDSLYDWKGRRKFEKQELSFPRVMLRDSDGFYVNGIPRKLMEAVCEASFYGYQASVELFTTHSDNGSVKKECVEGAVEMEYYSSKDEVVDYISKYAALDSLLKGLYKTDAEKKEVSAIACHHGLI